MPGGWSVAYKALYSLALLKLRKGPELAWTGHQGSKLTEHMPWQAAVWAS